MAVLLGSENLSVIEEVVLLSSQTYTALRTGIADVTCIGGGGQGGGAHSLHEWYLNDEENDESIQLALLITLSQAGLAK